MGPCRRRRGLRLWSEKGREGREGRRDGVFTPELLPQSLQLHPGPPLPPLPHGHGHAEGREGLLRPELCWRRPLAPSPAAVVSTEPRHPGRQDVSGLAVGPPARSALPAPLELALAAAWAHWAGVQPVPVCPGLCGVSTEVSVPGALHPYLGPLPGRGSPKETPVSEAHSAQHWPPNPTQGVAVPWPQL